MKSIRYYTGTFLLFIFSNGFSQQSQIRTEGTNSPAVWAQNVSIKYGVNEKVVLSLIEIYATKGLSSKEREVRVEKLLNDYNGLSKTDKSGKKLSQNGKKQLGISNDNDIVNVIEWEIFTEGDNSPAIFALGDVEIWYGISQEAFREIHKVLKEKEFEIDKLGQRLREQVMRYKQLEEGLSQYDKKDPNYLIAKECLENGKLDCADSAYEKLITNSELALAKKYFERANIKTLKYSFYEAKALLKKAISLDSTNPIYVYSFASILGYLGRYDSSLVYFGFANSLNKKTKKVVGEDLVWVYLSKANAELKADKIRQGLGTLREGLNIFFSYKTISDSSIVEIKIYEFFADCYSYLERFDSARYYIKKASDIASKRYVKTHPIFTNLNVIEAVISANNGEFEKAIKICKTEIRNVRKSLGEVNITVGDISNKIGMIYASMLEFDSSLVYFLRELSNDSLIFSGNHPKIALDFYNISGILEKKGELDSAITLLERAEKINNNFGFENHSHNASVLGQLAMCYDKKGRVNESFRNIRRAIAIYLSDGDSLRSNIATSFNSIGLLHKKSRNYDSAFIYYKLSKTILQSIGKGNHPSIYYAYFNLATLYNERGKSDSAIAYYDRCEQLVSNSQKLRFPNVNKYRVPYVQLLWAKAKSKYYSAQKDESKSIYNKAKKISLRSNDSVLIILSYHYLIQFFSNDVACDSVVYLSDKVIPLCERYISDNLIALKNNKVYDSLTRDLNYIYFDKAMCLSRLNREPEAKLLFDKVRIYANKVNDQYLLGLLRRFKK